MTTLLGIKIFGTLIIASCGAGAVGYAWKSGEASWRRVVTGAIGIGMSGFMTWMVWA